MNHAHLSTSLSPSARIQSIDALRGFVMLVMMVDHIREFFYSHAPVPDPMDVATTPPALFFTRLAAHICAPTFVALTGVSAWLYGQRAGPRETSLFLAKRGLFLIALELTLVGFGWSFSFSAPIIFLQVIWVIGLSMLALAALLHLPRPALIAVGLIIVLGHNLLDPIHFAPDQPGYTLWRILHDRGFIDLPGGMRARTSYPLIPWIGIITLGYAAAPLITRPFAERQRWMIGGGLFLLAFFLVLRGVNIYGDLHPRIVGETPLLTVMSFLNVTKYPPSADFALLTLGLALLLLALLDRTPPRLAAIIAVFGAAPLFYYLIHIYSIHLLHIVIGGGADYSFPNVASIWALTAILAVPLWFACRWFGGVKRRSGQWWLRYL